MRKLIIVHNLNYKLLMHQLREFPSSLKKNYQFKDLKKIKKNEYKKVIAFFGARPEVNILKKFINLKKIILISRGVDLNLKSFSKESKIKLYTLDKDFVKPVVATIYAYIFGLDRGLDVSFENRKRNKYEKIFFDKFRHRLNNVYDENFLLVGYGAVNKLLFKSLKNFTKNITIINRTKYNIKKTKFIAGLKNLKYHVKNKAFIINSLPLTIETKNIFNQEIFKKFDRYCTFINVGRGETINQKDLKKYYFKKKILIGFDVYKDEYKRNINNPIPEKFFLINRFGNFFTPHIASYDKNIWVKYMKFLKKILGKK